MKKFKVLFLINLFADFLKCNLSTVIKHLFGWNSNYPLIFNDKSSIFHNFCTYVCTTLVYRWIFFIVFLKIRFFLVDFALRILRSRKVTNFMILSNVWQFEIVHYNFIKYTTGRISILQFGRVYFDSEEYLQFGRVHYNLEEYITIRKSKFQFGRVLTIFGFRKFLLSSKGRLPAQMVKVPKK